jgi:sugar phosphate permease
MISKELGKKVFLNKLKVFWITFILYAAVHSCSSVWSYSKDNLRSDPTYSFSTNFFGTCDLAFLLAYSLSFYFFGWIGDKIDLRIFISVGLFGICMSFGALGLMRYFCYHNEPLFVFFMALNGMFQSVVSFFLISFIY